MAEFVLIKVKVNDTYQPIGHKRIVQYKGQLIDLDGDGAGTSEDGHTIRDVRRRNKGKLTVKFDGLTLEEFNSIMTAIDSEDFDIIYFCGGFREVNVHAGDRNFELKKAKNEADNRWSLDVSFIEN